MHILYVTGETLSENGGATTHIQDLSRTFVALGHRVTILSNGDGPVRKEKGITFYQRRVRRFGMTLPFFQVGQILRKEDYDIILERYSVMGGAGYILSKAWNIPLVLEVNGPHIQEAMDLGQLRNPLLISALKKWTDIQYAHAKRIIMCCNCVDNGYKKRLLGRYWQKGVYVKNGVLEHSVKKEIGTRKQYGLGTSTVFVFIGSFKPWMGVIDLVKAAAQLKKEFPSLYKRCSFLLVGEGKDSEQVQEFIQQHSLDRCIMTGALAPDKIPSILAASDVGVAPFNTAYHKTLGTMGYYMSPVKIFEYMMAQKPIISTRYPEITGMFDPPKGGLAVPPGDASALMNAMKKLLVADRLKMGKYNRKKALAKYTWETSARIQLHEFAMILRDK